MIEDVLLNFILEVPTAGVGIYAIKRMADALIASLQTVEHVAKQQSQSSADMGQAAMQHKEV